LLGWLAPRGTELGLRAFLCPECGRRDERPSQPVDHVELRLCQSNRHHWSEPHNGL
jgi:hypothetical protein